ncbi:MAG: ribonuclease HI [Cyanobacteria bacterium P01_A01_bin.45]
MPSTAKIESIYTDGACSGNPGPGGWGVVVYFHDSSVHEIGDAAAKTTNNRMEMQAAIAALEFLKRSGQSHPVTLYTDSEYLINCVTKWVHGWKKKGWKKSDGKPVLNQDLLSILDELNSSQISWKYVRGHAGNIGNERCDEIARAFASGGLPSLKQVTVANTTTNNTENNHVNDYYSESLNQTAVAKISDSHDKSTIINKATIKTSKIPSDTTKMDQNNQNNALNGEEQPKELRIMQLRNLVETLRIADEIADQGYLITSSELADLMDVHASAVTSRGDQWRWRNWIVSRVRREGNQILWELERADVVEEED